MNGGDGHAPAAEPASPAGEALATDRREQAIRDALRTLLRDRHRELFGNRVSATRRLELTLTLSADPATWAPSFDPPLGEQLDVALTRGQLAAAVFQSGHVFCFRCERADCEHSLPPTPLAVFRGYGTTGQPSWSDFVQVAIEAGDPRLEQLYVAPPAVLAFVQLGNELRRHQLAAFGRASRSYSILGQVVAGYLPLERHAERIGAAADRTALTIQVVETRNAAGRRDVRLNTVAAGLNPDQWLELLTSGWRPSVARCLREAGRRLEAAARPLTEPESAAALKRIPLVLSQLARGLEQGARQAARRTTHAEERRADRRPVHKALKDAVAATPQDLFVDEKHGTWIACGGQGRAHVFNEEGRHVTSMVLPADGAAFRVRTGRWRAMTPDEIATFRSRLQTHLS